MCAPVILNRVVRGEGSLLLAIAYEDPSVVDQNKFRCPLHQDDISNTDSSASFNGIVVYLAPRKLPINTARPTQPNSLKRQFLHKQPARAVAIINTKEAGSGTAVAAGGVWLIVTN